MVFRKIIVLLLVFLAITLVNCNKEENNNDLVSKTYSPNDWFSAFEYASPDTIVVFKRYYEIKETFKVNRYIEKDRNLVKWPADSLIYGDRVVIEYKSGLYNFNFRFGIKYNEVYGHDIYIEFANNSDFNGFSMYSYLDTGIINTDPYPHPVFMSPNLIKYYDHYYKDGKSLYDVYKLSIIYYISYTVKENDIRSFFINKQKGLLSFSQENGNEWYLQ